MKIALAQINTTVGAFKENSEKVLYFVKEAKYLKADLVVFPELTITGYPPQDLLTREDFIEDNINTINKLAKEIDEIGALVGFVDKNYNEGKPLFNACAFIYRGKIESIYYKTLLPSYDVFNEDRYFEPSATRNIIQFKGETFGISICEDIWNDKNFFKKRLYHINPVEEIVKEGAKFIVNMSASPYFIGKRDLRIENLKNIAKNYNIPICYVNLVGGNDTLIFDGASAAIDKYGKVVILAPSFEEGIVIFDTKEDYKKEVLLEEDGLDRLYKGLILGTKDYVHKCGFKKVILGLSGGIDSALTCVIAKEALGKENVLGVLMPSKYSSSGSIEDAKALCKNLQINYKIIPIQNIFNSYLEELKDLFKGLPEDITEENLQPRIRANILMALSNKFGYLLLSTGNKSEVAVGYCTLYGDMCGGLSVIGDLPKTLVYKLSNYINRNGEIIPKNTIIKAPSAELKYNQKDQDSLPPYEVLDEILTLYIEENKRIKEIIDKGYDEILLKDIINKIDKNEFKRKQAAPSLKVSPKAFGSGRIMPIAQKYNYWGEK